MIVNITDSNKADKRFEVTMNNGKKYNFGLKDGSTLLDHKDKTKRKNYWARHYANSTENERINKLIPSASLFSAYLLRPTQATTTAVVNVYIRFPINNVPICIS